MNTEEQRHAERLAVKAKAIIDRSELENRARSADENVEIAELMKEIAIIRSRGKVSDEVARIGKEIGVEGSTATDPSYTIGGGWERLVKTVDLKAGQTKAQVPLDGLLRTKDLTGPNAEDFPPVRAPGVATGIDARYLYPSLARQPLGQELGVSEFRQVGSGTIASGNVERDPVSTDSKAELDVELELVTEQVKQVAVTVSDVPNAILEADVTLRAFLQQQMRVRLDEAIDTHCLNQIDAAVPPSGVEGATLIAEIRHAIAAMAAVGTRPTIVALSPEDSVELDLFTTGTDQEFVFPLRDSGSSSPLFGLRVVEAKGVVYPVLIDPMALGLLYVGDAKFEVDPYSGFKKNLSTVRLEANVLFHVRNADGAYLAYAS